MLKLLLRLLAILIGFITAIAGVIYAGFMIIWMHAPAPQVVFLTLLICSIPAAVSWLLLRAAKRLQTHVQQKT